MKQALLMLAAFLTFAVGVYHSGQRAREQDAAIRQDGEQAGLDGVPAEGCPWQPTWQDCDRRKRWLEGWRAGWTARQQRREPSRN